MRLSCLARNGVGNGFFSHGIGRIVLIGFMDFDASFCHYGYHGLGFCWCYLPLVFGIHRFLLVFCVQILTV